MNMRTFGSILLFGGIAWAYLGSGFLPYLSIAVGLIVLVRANTAEGRPARKQARSDRRRAKAGQGSPFLDWLSD
ncbi:hypothetical protein QM716_28535 [Rhodococcus sp. IEGM 1409]|uniref:hypothetical protein n=1 Tax=Rhodococcus sp. IEGM 1409 TaxID=3047082 RepID=UPI0024B821E1|nr:hypothetical protein [Rhodococcus sp. IEGM 1409]MDI9903818.1 hypothetical protein [Rhodococcus sp. IEGM 1409]